MSQVISILLKQPEQKKGFGTYGMLGWAIFFIWIAMTLFIPWLFNLLFGWLVGGLGWILPALGIVMVIYGILAHRGWLATGGWVALTILWLFTTVLIPLFAIFSLGTLSLIGGA